MDPLYWLLPIVLLATIGIISFWLWGRSSAFALAPAREQFLIQREALQNAFFQAAASSGKPRGLRWKECQWNDLIEWVRDKKNGQLLALVGVTISFEAIEGSDMEGLAAVG